MEKPTVLKFINHDKLVVNIAMQYGWLPGARYTHLRNVRHIKRLAFLDIDWRHYNFKKHLQITKEKRPLVTVARDILNINDIDTILEEAYELKKYAEHVIIVPKDKALSKYLNNIIPNDFLLGYSVNSSYGLTPIEPKYFQRPVHLLGGRPDIQRKLAQIMPVVSIDNNRITIDAKYGDFFDGETFRPHPIGGYEICIRESIKNINKLWEDYVPPSFYKIK